MRPNRRLLPFVTVAIAIAAAAAAAMADDPARRPPAPAVIVSIACLLDADAPALAFTVTNVGEREITRGELAVNTNRILVLAEDGRMSVHHAIADPPFDKPPPPKAVIRPRESYTWERKLADLFHDPQMSGPGVYRVYWQFGGTRTGPQRILRKAAVAGVPETPRFESSPRAAMKELYSALGGRPGDLQRVLDRYRAGDPQEEAASSLLFEHAKSALLLRAKAQNKFGSDAIANWDPTGEGAAKRSVDAAQVEVPDDLAEARIVFPDWTARVLLQGSRWVVAKSTFAPGTPASRELGRRTNLLVRFTDDLEANKYPTFRDMENALSVELSARPKSSEKP
jgi:hypothetical protein